ncbi:MAG TPA: tyrosine-protein phosphatase [Pyrinomonadaceae bacterium]|jgi:protein tyrosine/serine phosphatase
MFKVGNNRFVLRLVVATSVVAFLAGCSGGGKRNTNFPNVKIRNFGQMDHRFYRGAQPREDEFKELKNLGITTVIDLRDDPRSYERAEVESLGMRYVNIPMDDRTYPRNEQVEDFFKVVDDPDTGKFFVHCAGGRHRTGVMGAVYRFRKDGWDYDRAYKEMEEYDFYTRWGHGPMKDFVWDYWQQQQAQSGR